MESDRVVFLFIHSFFRFQFLGFKNLKTSEAVILNVFFFAIFPKKIFLTKVIQGTQLNTVVSVNDVYQLHFLVI